MSVVFDVYGREVLDSRGNPTVEVEVTLVDGTFAGLRKGVERITKVMMGALFVMLVDMEIDVRAMRDSVYRTAREVDRYGHTRESRLSIALMKRASS